MIERNKNFRRINALKEFKNRVKNCINIWKFTHSKEDIDIIKHKKDIPHSINSNWENSFETKRIKNRQQRFKEKEDLKKELQEI